MQGLRTSWWSASHLTASLTLALLSCSRSSAELARWVMACPRPMVTGGSLPARLVNSRVDLPLGCQQCSGGRAGRCQSPRSMDQCSNTSTGATGQVARWQIHRPGSAHGEEALGVRSRRRPGSQGLHQRRPPLRPREPRRGRRPVRSRSERACRLRWPPSRCRRAGRRTTGCGRDADRPLRRPPEPLQGASPSRQKTSPGPAESGGQGPTARPQGSPPQGSPP